MITLTFIKYKLLINDFKKKFLSIQIKKFKLYCLIKNDDINIIIKIKIKNILKKNSCLSKLKNKLSFKFFLIINILKIFLPNV